MPREKSTIESLVDKLINTSCTVNKRMGLKPAEAKRVKDAFALLAAGGPPPNLSAMLNKTYYVDFLQRVQTVLGPKGVVLCAVGLGVSAVTSMGDKLRVDLPHVLKRREGEIAWADLQNIANTYSTER
ncbi:hypothetical protein B0H63DRAFT_470858, partial [Podospora didyma]